VLATPNSEVAVTDVDTARPGQTRRDACMHQMSLVSCTMQPFAMLSLHRLAGRGSKGIQTDISACDDDSDTRTTNARHDKRIFFYRFAGSLEAMLLLLLSC